MISLESMSLEEKVGQLFMVGFNKEEPNSEIIKLIQKYRIGGIFVYTGVLDKVRTLYDLVETLKEDNSGNQIPLFMAVDQEGGKLNMMPLELRRIPSAKMLASTGNKNLLYESGNVTGEMLRKIGFNMNLAPVLDVEDARSTDKNEERSFSSNPNIVASYGSVNMKGMNEQKVITAIKHFPGKGSTVMNSNSIIIPYTRKTLQRLEETDLLPFKEAISNGAECMMVGHINLTKFNLFAPATTSSKVISGIIRSRYKYNGVIMTDDLGVSCIEIQYGIKDAARRAILAGNDILMIKELSKAEGVIEYITKLVNKGKIPMQKINESVSRILKLKAKYIVDEKLIADSDVEHINKRIDDIIKQIDTI